MSGICIIVIYQKWIKCVCITIFDFLKNNFKRVVIYTTKVILKSASFKISKVICKAALHWCWQYKYVMCLHAMSCELSITLALKVLLLCLRV